MDVGGTAEEVWHSMCPRRLKNNMIFTVFGKAQPSILLSYMHIYIYMISTCLMRRQEDMGTIPIENMGTSPTVHSPAENGWAAVVSHCRVKLPRQCLVACGWTCLTFGNQWQTNKGSAEHRMLFTVCSDFRATEALYLLCVRRLSRAKYGSYGVFAIFESSAKQTLLFTVLSKARPSKSMVLIMFRRIRRAKYGIYNICGVHFDFFTVSPADPSGEPNT